MADDRPRKPRSRKPKPGGKDARGNRSTAKKPYGKARVPTAPRPPRKIRTAASGSTPTTFAACGVPPELVRVLSDSGITKPFPIQAATLADASRGRDILGRGRTGSGKTLAFALPVVTRLAGGVSAPKRPRAVVLAPTRELANQIHATFVPLAAAYGLKTVAVYGGAAPQPQIAALRRGADIVVATPGRLDDHIRSGHVRLDHVAIAVIDEADHMADLGFLPEVRALLDQMPRQGQRLLFSATLDGDVDVLVQQYLDAPKTHSVDDGEEASEASHHVLRVDSGDRLAIMTDLAKAPGRTIVFTRTRLGAAKLTEQLTHAGVAAVDLHGDLSQAVRARNLRAFAQGRATTLVATDIAARGIHVDDVARVVHADPPDEHKSYVHRSGRTARAGAGGTVITIMTGRQTRVVRELTRRAGVTTTTTRVEPGHPFLQEIAPGERTTSRVEPEPRRSRDEDRSSRPRKAGHSNSRRGGNKSSTSDRSAEGRSTGGRSAGSRKRTQGGKRPRPGRHRGTR